MDPLISDIINRQNAVISNIDGMLNTSVDAITNYSKIKDVIDLLSDDSINFYKIVDNFNTNLTEISSVYSEIYNTLKNNLFFYNIIKDKYSNELVLSMVDVKILDKDLNVFQDISYDIKNNNLILYNGNYIDNVYYLNVSQNMNNTLLFSNIVFSEYSKENMNNNMTKIFLNVSDDNSLQSIIENKLLTDTLLLVNKTSKYRIVKFGGTVKNDAKKLALYVFPAIKESSIDNASIHNYLFDDELIELSFVDYDMNDISSIYFNNSQRNLDTGEMIIYDKNKLPKFVFNFLVENNIEKRITNG